MGLPPEDFVEKSSSVWEKLEITERNRSIMNHALSSGWADRELDTCERLGVKIVTFKDKNYPSALRLIKTPPLLLYVAGNMLSESARTIAVVGTRGCSSYAAGIAREIGRRASSMGWNVVSGGAKGIDGASHHGCVESGGCTAAVLGTGVNVVYPSDHRELFKRITEKGALYSEYPLGEKGEAWHFPRRNRIIVGLASKIVVVEAPHKSGAMITASGAADEGREVWAVPGRIDDERGEGSNRLIFDGAMPLINLDIFFGTTQRYAERTLFDDSESPGVRQKPRNLPPEAEKILSILAIRGDNTIDNLADEAKMSAAEVFKIMSLMSISGLVYSSGPGRYRIND
jgi:DNA processing protein